MRKQKILCAVLISFLITTTAAVALAADFGWMSGLNAAAQEDPVGYRTRLADRFNIGQATVSDVLNVAQNPAEAYMLFRLGEMSSKPTDQVIQKYNSEKDKGWGALAKSLGIKPGSPEFRSLKNGDDLDGLKNRQEDKNKDKDNDKNKGKGKSKAKGNGKGK